MVVVREKFCIGFRNSLVPRIQPTFFGKLWISLIILAIIIDHKVSLHPRIIHLLFFRKMPSRVLIPPFLGRGWYTCREWIFPLASIDAEIFVWRNERFFTPICLFKSASCCPIVGVPYAWEQVHWLLIWEEIVCVICIFVYPDWYSVHKEPVQEQWIH